MLLVGAIAGWLAGQIMKGAGFWLIGNVIVGIMGAIVASFFLPGFLPIDGLVESIISATIGTSILLFIDSLLIRA